MANYFPLILFGLCMASSITLAFHVPYDKAVLHSLEQLRPAIDCKDLDEACPSWVMDGECANSGTSAILTDCRASCGLCEGVGDEDIRGWLDIVLYGLRNARLALEIVPEGTRNANVYIPIVEAIHQATNLAKGLHAGLQHRLSQREYRIAFHEVVKETHAKLKAAIPLLTIDYPSEQLNMVTPLVNVPVQDAVRTRAGLEVPTIGFGTHALASKPIADIANIVAHALATGYRRIDVYDDPNVETGVGRAIDAASRTMNLPRDKLFVSVKVQVGQGGEMDGFDEKLARLGLGYVDALLLAGELLAEMEYAKLGWATAEMAKASGKAKSIGVHDVDVVALEQLLAGDLRPELVQNRFWPLHQGSYENPEGTNVHQLCEAEGIVLDGYSTLSSHPHKLSFMNDPHVRRIGEKLGVSPAQLMLRWALQQGVAVSPSSSDKDHITGNFQLSDFELGFVSQPGTYHTQEMCMGFDLPLKLRLLPRCDHLMPRTFNAFAVSAYWKFHAYVFKALESTGTHAVTH